MTDLEKVIKGLECCMITPGSCPEECPYRGQGNETEYCDEKIIKDVYTLLKAQKAEAADAPKPDSDIGCWYDITHNYTLEQVVSALKPQEPRVMTLEEVQQHNNQDGCVWFEQPSYNAVAAFVIYDEECTEIISPYLLGEPINHGCMANNFYRLTWRCWTSRPSAAEMEATPWN